MIYNIIQQEKYENEHFCVVSFLCCLGKVLRNLGFALILVYSYKKGKTLCNKIKIRLNG